MNPLRIGTFNLLHGIAMGPAPTDPDLLRTAAVELGADVLGIQEVDRHQERSGSVDQTAEIADAVGAAHWRFVPVVHGTPGEERGWHEGVHDDGENTDGPTYGIGMVSRLPVLSWRVKRFPAAPFAIPLVVPGPNRPRIVRIPDEPRAALAAVVDGPRGPFTVMTAHLSFVPGYNVRQLRAIARWAERFPGPVLLAGDFNLPGSLPRRITGWRALADGATYPSMNPKVQFDHVLAHGLRQDAVVSSQVHRLAVSDHCGLSVDLDLD